MSRYINHYDYRYITPEIYRCIYPSHYSIKNDNYSIYTNTYLDPDFLDHTQEHKDGTPPWQIPNNLPDPLSKYTYKPWDQSTINDIKIYDVKYYSMFDKYPLIK